jgi:HTH-type transcriptional regulator, global nitrogen regulator NrpRI
MVSPFTTPADVERKTLMILRILHEAGQPVGSRLISRRMQDRGLPSSERAVRYHFKLMDERGLTRLIGNRDGRVITDKGIEEIGRARVRDKVGLANSRIEILAFQTTFEPETGRGLLPVNISLLSEETFPDALRIMEPVFNAGYTVSRLVAVAGPGQRLAGLLVPEGRVGLATVCSIVVNGVLLKNGIPMDSKFGGILQVKNRHPLRFVELIHYSGSSLAPSEVFIRGKMTSVRSVVDEGEGMILANFREIPAPCLPLMEQQLAGLARAGIDGILMKGDVSEPVCQTPVEMNRVGIVLIGGLNPVACVGEAGLDVDNRAMSAVMEYGEMEPFDQLLKRHQGQPTNRKKAAPRRSREGTPGRKQNQEY